MRTMKDNVIDIVNDSLFKRIVVQRDTRIAVARYSDMKRRSLTPAQCLIICGLADAGLHNGPESPKKDGEQLGMRRSIDLMPW